MGSDDPFSGVDYRRLIPWRQRIEREAPFLEAVFSTAPERSVLDVGCGSGEHALHLARAGYRVVGIDRSESQIEAAREYQDACGEYGPRFLLGDVQDLEQLEASRFGAALCIGNMLPNLEDDDLAGAADALHARLLPGAPWLIQILNYERVVAQKVRALPVTLRPGDHDGEEWVFVRIMTPDAPRHVLFYPAVLKLVPGADPPLEVTHAGERRLRAWRLPEIEALLGSHGFTIASTHGTMTGEPFDPTRSTDLVVVARRT